MSDILNTRDESNFNSPLGVGGMKKLFTLLFVFVDESCE